jgi:23S rRNA-/tRNA-specific pseudouridylate synthase
LSSISTDDEEEDENTNSIPSGCPTDEQGRPLREGTHKGFYIVHEYPKCPTEFDLEPFQSNTTTATTGKTTINTKKEREEEQKQEVPVDAEDTIQRLALETTNVTLPVALVLLDPITYPSLSRARKVCRRGNILIQRSTSDSTDQHHLPTDPTKEGQEKEEPSIVGSSKSSSTSSGKEDDDDDLFVGRVGDRVYPGDSIFLQVRMGDGDFAASRTIPHARPPIELDVIYEDDHMALVNKPAGIVVYRQGSGSNGFLSVRAVLPWVLRPPRQGTYSVLTRPASVHRLDKPTSGILVIAKTKPALVNLGRQFHDRIVQKTYTAIVNGIPEEYSEKSKTTLQVAEIMGQTIKHHNNNHHGRNDTNGELLWQLVDAPLDDRHAVTFWRAVRYVPSLHAHDGYLTLVEMQPKTGRFHQLRRHMALTCQRPILGDTEYDGKTSQAMKFRDRGLFLCANRITLEHPYYNTKQGRQEWERSEEAEKLLEGPLWLSKESKVMVSANIELPAKFENLMKREEERYQRLSD